MFARPVYSACLSQQQAANKMMFHHAAMASVRAAPAQQAARRSIASSARASFRQQESTSQQRAGPSSFLLLLAGGSSLALLSSPIRCDVTTSAGRPYAEPHTVSVQGPGSAALMRKRQEEPAVESSLDLRSLSFGAVAGISTGIFVKKGLKAAGFLLGGVFVLLQYLATRGMVNVDWRSMASRYESTVDAFAGTGAGSRVQRVGGRVMDFLLADFPPRATFAAGLALGLRMG